MTVDTSSGDTITYSGLSAEIGRRPSVATPNIYFNGLIDDVRIYNRVFTAAEIQALFQLGQ